MAFTMLGLVADPVKHVICMSMYTYIYIYICLYIHTYLCTCFGVGGVAR